MSINYGMDAVALIMCIVMIACVHPKYGINDLKDKIFVRMLQGVTVLVSCNLFTSFIIQKNLFDYIKIANAGMYLHYVLLVWVGYIVNLYLYEVVNRNNRIPVRVYVICIVPVFATIITLLINSGNHIVFELSSVNDRIEVIFNGAYVVPYIMGLISSLGGLIYSIVNCNTIINRKQRVLFHIPVVIILAGLLQYRMSSLSVFSCGCCAVLLLIYIQSYSLHSKIDYLTRILSSSSFEKIISYRTSNNQPMYVVRISLNNFKYINREYGYKNGDRLLESISKYLKGIVGHNILARCGGDQFGIIIEGSDIKQVQGIVDRIIARMDEPWTVDTISTKMSAHIAVVAYPQMCESAEEIMELLTYLNRHENNNKKTCVVYCDEAMKQRMNRRTQIKSILKGIPESGNIFVEYQPIYDVEKNAYTKAEALFRLNDPVIKDISPAEFFPIAEEHGYVVDIGYVLIEQVCKYIDSLKKESIQVPSISVNFSRQQLMAEQAPQKIKEILDKYQISPELIPIEIPEEVFDIEYDSVKKRMLEMSELGFRFYLDGFGTGFLNLSYLMELPFDMIKINKKMIRDAQNNQNIYLLVSAMTAVFEENGIAILGDGIESEEAKEKNEMLLMNYMQGYFFSKPVSGDDAKQYFCMKNVYDNRLFEDAQIDVIQKLEQEMMSKVNDDYNNIHAIDADAFFEKSGSIDDILALLQKGEE